MRLLEDKFINSIIHSFVQQIFIEIILRATDFSKQ